ncbi:hypothetical protein A1351_09425 [Methylosinus sp. R-45379]|uniref:peptidoglycan recognition protein family protein n=1 Tax=unclassified Methylosinus TaxID=2624500 RepID=UPI000466DA08|nr:MULTISPECIES: peptidoglycan recognition family protein [unclassified Methylosinus]OAI30121.1 hypothetical protein A1351_09425 [Methylosinus sp. R-45379]TDX64891.1 N-acetylmuramoyl-L-alanine amidase [Methylosinus sp. sav-2]
MGDLTQDFFAAVRSGVRWKDAYDLCNGMDMFGMLRAFAGLEPRYLQELRARMNEFDVWGGPNMPRIRFAMDTVQKRSLPTPPPGLPQDQVQAARLFLESTTAHPVGPGSPARAVIEKWAKRFTTVGIDPGDRFLYRGATPYLALKHKTQGGMTPLADKCHGPALVRVHGLAVHCTAGAAGPDCYTVSRYRCVDTWNNNGASAHFAISGNGDVAQFIPTNYIAWAQGPGNDNWISVEVDNDGRAPMTINQLTATKLLFQWVCKTFATPRTVATGHLVGDPGWDDITRAICDASDASVSMSRAETLASRGLSCHRWLQFAGGKPCPGKGILSQLASIAKPGALC